MTRQQWLVKLYFLGGSTFERVVTSHEEALRIADQVARTNPPNRVKIERLTSPVVLLSREH